MKSFNMNKIDIKFIILGHDNVGKKSFVKKLHAMNSSDTKEIKKEYTLPDKAQIKKILFSKDNIFKDENELILYEKKLNKTKRMCDFKKFITIEFNHIEISSNIINKPLPILISDNRNIIDDLESGEKQHNFKFQNVKTHLNQKINETVKENKNRDFRSYIILLFMFDYSNLDSFEKIKFYYSEIKKMYNFEEINNSEFNIIPVFIGNKVDAKTILPNDLKGIYEEYFRGIPYKHYEISTAYYFNFEKFFKLLFVDTIVPLISKENDYSHNIFMEKLETILFQNKSFNKAEKHQLINNNVPGPEYDQEIFSVCSKETLLKALNDTQSRFTFKPFINKTGPKFYDNKKKRANASETASKKLRYKNEFETIDKDKIKNELINGQKQNGYATNRIFSVGNRPSTYGFKRERKELFRKMNNELNDIFKTDVVFYRDCTSNKNKLKQSNSFNDKNHSISANSPKNNNRGSVLKNNIFQNQEKDLRNFDKQFEVVSKNRKAKEEEKLKMLEKLKEKQEEQFKQHLERLKNENELRKRASASKRKVKKIEVFPQYVNVTKGFVNDKSKFTMGGRTKTDFLFNKIDPAFMKIDTDFDKVMKNPNLSFCKAERFNKTGMALRTHLKEEYDKQNEYYYNQEVEYYNMKKDIAKKRNEIAEDRQKKLEVLKVEKAKKPSTINPMINMTHDTPGPGAYNINFDLVEENSPRYTLKGKHKGELFEVNNNYSDPTKVLDIDSTQNVQSNPDFNVTKESFPRVIFSKEKRFREEKVIVNTQTNFKKLQNMLDSESDFFKPLEVNNDRNKTFYMGKSQRFIDNSDKSIPGPNKYMLPGFVDELMKKTGSKFNVSTNINSTKNNFFNKTKASSLFSKEEMDVNISNMI